MPLFKEGDLVRMLSSRYGYADMPQGSQHKVVAVEGSWDNQLLRLDRHPVIVVSSRAVDLIEPAEIEKEEVVTVFKPGDRVESTKDEYSGVGVVVNVPEMYKEYGWAYKENKVWVLWPDKNYATWSYQNTLRKSSAVKQEEKGMNKFWTVWNPQSQKPVTQRFQTKEQANTVAQRMAKEHNATFYVMEAVGVAELVQVQYKEIN